jgi:hypothetical protein
MEKVLLGGKRKVDNDHSTSADENKPKSVCMVKVI